MTGFLMHHLLNIRKIEFQRVLIPNIILIVNSSKLLIKKQSAYKEYYIRFTETNIRDCIFCKPNLKILCTIRLKIEISLVDRNQKSLF